MLKNFILLVLITGVFCSSELNVKDIKPDQPQNVEVKENSAVSKGADPSANKGPVAAELNTASSEPKNKKTSPKLNKEQIDMLAEKVLRIHGVEPGKADEENMKNIAELRRVVASVEQNLNEKLKLSQKQAREKLNVKEKAQENIQIEEKIKKHDEQNKLDQPTWEINNDIGKKVQSKEESLIKPSISKSMENEAKYEGVEEILEENIQMVEAVQNNNEPIQLNENIENQIKDQNLQADDDEIKKIEINDKIDITKSDTEQKTSPYHGNSKSESVIQNTVEANDKSLLSEFLAETNSNTNEINEKRTNNNEQNIEDDVQSGVDEDVKETENFEEDESGNIKNIDEDAASEECHLKEECQNRKNLYSEEYNTGNIHDESLENNVQDNHIQRIVKFVTSFFN